MAVELPEHSPKDLQELADTIAARAEGADKVVTRELLELAMRGKQSPRRPQAEPCGLFEQTQSTLF